MYCVEELQQPVATIALEDEHSVHITCFTWVNTNRIAVGHSDGSIALWSVVPCRLLLRHPVGPSSIMDISSAYPSHPFIVAAVPVGGLTVLVDLNRPNLEITYLPTVGVVFQHGLLAWSQHLQGWISIWPSSVPANNLISFMPLRVFPQPRLVIALEGGQPTSLAMGTCHPYCLVGASDGSVWVTQLFHKVSFYRTKTFKLRLFQHDYKDLGADGKQTEADEQQLPTRGVARILHDFKPEENGSGRPWIRNAADGSRKSKAQIKEEIENEELDEELKPGQWSGKVYLHDPLTRVTALAWNPNMRFSWWAAAAVGSGLVRIMDLGLEPAI